MKKQAAAQNKPKNKEKKGSTEAKPRATEKNVSSTPASAALQTAMSDETNDLLKEANQAILGVENQEKPKALSLLQKSTKEKASGGKKKHSAAGKSSSTVAAPSK